MPNRGPADTFKGMHAGETVFVVGSSPSLNELDSSIICGFTTIGSNRILLHKQINPTYLVLCDRAPYIEELKSGRLHEYALNGGVILASTTIWDDGIRCRGAEVQDQPDFDYWAWRVGTRSSPISLDSAKSPINSFGTIAGPMMEFAAIFGAKRIVLAGVDLWAPDANKSMHFYQCETNAERTQTKQGSIAPNLCTDLMREFKRLAAIRAIEIINVSPWKGTPISGVFGNTPLSDIA